MSNIHTIHDKPKQVNQDKIGIQQSGQQNKMSGSSSTSNSTPDTRTNEMVTAKLELGKKVKAKIASVSAKKTGNRSGRDDMTALDLKAAEEVEVTIGNVTAEMTGSSSTSNGTPDTRANEMVTAEVDLGKNTKAEIGNVSAKKSGENSGGGGGDNIKALNLKAAEDAVIVIGDVSAEMDSTSTSSHDTASTTRSNEIIGADLKADQKAKVDIGNVTAKKSGGSSDVDNIIGLKVIGNNADITVKDVTAELYK